MSNGLAMAISIATLYSVIVALLQVPGLRPDDEVLACDRRGGYWSSAQGVCHLPQSPLAGMAN